MTRAFAAVVAMACFALVVCAVPWHAFKFFYDFNLSTGVPPSPAGVFAFLGAAAVGLTIFGVGLAAVLIAFDVKDDE